MTTAVSPESRRTRRRRSLPRLRAAGLRMARWQKRVPLSERVNGGVQHAVTAVAAAVLAWLPTQALGLREGFWAAITAIAVVQNEFGATRITARDQFTGAAIGGTIAVAVALAAGQHLWSFALAAVLAITGCWLINVASAARLAAITATIILLVPHGGTVQHMTLSRVGEVGWGVLVAILVAGAAAWLGRHWSFRNAAATDTG